jgi:hypothetical protein
MLFECVVIKFSSTITSFYGHFTGAIISWKNQFSSISCLHRLSIDCGLQNIPGPRRMFIAMVDEHIDDEKQFVPVDIGA